MAQIKYIASGFFKDAEKLLEDFVQENSMEFSVFANIWKQHNFSLIYFGRPNKKELAEFTQEIFNLSINFVTSRPLLYQVGGVFLLYALYRNQILSPPVKIRIVMYQFKNILTLREMASDEGHRSLHFVINYLMNNSFDFVACPHVMGPITQLWSEDERKANGENYPQVEGVSKTELLEIADSNILKEIDVLLTQYKNNSKLLKTPIVGASKNFQYEKAASRIDELLGRAKNVQKRETTRVKKSSSKDAGQSSIGSRRAQLKAFAFSKDVDSWLDTGANQTSDISEGSESASELPLHPPVRRATVPKKCVRKGKRKVGRPRKCAPEEAVEVPDSKVSSNNGESVLPKRKHKLRNPSFAVSRRYYTDQPYDDEALKLKFDSLITQYLPKKDELTSSSDDSEPSTDIGDIFF